MEDDDQSHYFEFLNIELKAQQNMHLEKNQGYHQMGPIRKKYKH